MSTKITRAPTALDWRRQTGLDRWDEMWEGVLHMNPSPSRGHQDFEWAMETWLRTHWAAKGLGKVYHNINVAEPDEWPDNYRIPDLVLLTPARYAIDRDKYFNGGPEIIVEIHSPDDETYEKFGFYHQVSVEEVWIIDRDSRMPEIHRRAETGFQQLSPDETGWLSSSVIPVRLKGVNRRLAMQWTDDAATYAEIPQDD